MSSYNNIRKIKYSKTPQDIVSLHEYIIFEDSHAKEKYVLFRFSNNVNQRLFEIKFEVSQFNSENRLLEKSTVIHKDFTAEPNGLFVPDAKLKINYECESLEVRLEEAYFDRVKWSGGEFSDNSYSFAEYAETVPVTAPQAAPKKNKTAPKAEAGVKKNKLGFNIRNIFRRNKAVFPSVFNVILTVIVAGLIIGSAFYFKSVSGAYAVDDFIVKESDGFVTVLQYRGEEKEVEIPDLLDGKRVSKIASGAFNRSDVESVTVSVVNSFCIETGAFENCPSLKTVSASMFCGKITVMQGAFKNCKSLQLFDMPTAELSKGCFDGTNAIKYLSFDSPVYEGGKLLDLFTGLNKITLDYRINANLSDDFFAGVTRR